MTAREIAPAFTLDDARASGMSKDQVYWRLKRGDFERIGHGAFVRDGDIDPAYTVLAAATAVQPTATLCLTSALVHHGLSDEIPTVTDIALPRGTRHPAGFTHAAWHSFATETFEIGRESIDIGTGYHASIYSAERTIVDCFRLTYPENNHMGYTALRRWSARKGSSPRRLLKTASPFPQAIPKLRFALEVLL